MDFPFWMQAADAIHESVFNVLYSEAGREGVAHEGDSPFSGRPRHRVLDVIAQPERVHVEIPFIPRRRDQRVSHRISPIANETIVSFEAQKEQAQQQGENENVSGEQRWPARGLAAT